jgi:hypothetical protein
VQFNLNYREQLPPIVADELDLLYAKLHQTFRGLDPRDTLTTIINNHVTNILNEAPASDEGGSPPSGTEVLDALYGAGRTAYQVVTREFTNAEILALASGANDFTLVAAVPGAILWPRFVYAFSTNGATGYSSGGAGDVVWGGGYAGGQNLIHNSAGSLTNFVLTTANCQNTSIRQGSTLTFTSLSAIPTHSPVNRPLVFRITMAGTPSGGDAVNRAVVTVLFEQFDTTTGALS